MRTTKRQLNPERRGEQNVDFPCFNFLQIARGDFGAFGQLLLRPALAHPFAAHVGPENLDSLPFFSGNGHGILHRLYPANMNDTYIVKKVVLCLRSVSTLGEWSRAGQAVNNPMG